MDNKEEAKDFMTEKDQLKLSRFERMGNRKEIDGPMSSMFIHSRTTNKEHLGSIEAAEARGAHGVTKEVIRVNQKGIEKKHRPLNTAVEDI